MTDYKAIQINKACAKIVKSQNVMKVAIYKYKKTK